MKVDGIYLRVSTDEQDLTRQTEIVHSARDHRFIKKITGSMLGLNAFHSAQATLDGIETAHMIRK